MANNENSRTISRRESARQRATTGPHCAGKPLSDRSQLSGTLLALAVGATAIACSNEPDASCGRTGQFGDGVNGLDRCWSPPENYCSGGATTLVTKACKPDQSYCCQFADSCFPCGWRDCVVGGVGCDGVPIGTDEQCGASDVRPTHELLCLD